MWFPAFLWTTPPIVPRELIVPDEHDENIPQADPRGRPEDVVLGKGEEERIPHGIDRQDEETEQPGNEEGVGRGIFPESPTSGRLGHSGLPMEQSHSRMNRATPYVPCYPP